MKSNLKDYILEQYELAIKAYQKCKDDIQTNQYLTGVIYGLTLVLKEIIKDERKTKSLH